MNKITILILCSFSLFSQYLYGASVEEAKEGIVKIEHPQYTGTGFFIESTETLVTSAHTLLNENGLIPLETLKIIQIGQQKNISAKITEVLALSLMYDLVLLKVESYNGSVLTFGELIPEEEVYVIGFPISRGLSIITGGHVKSWYANYEFISHNSVNLHGVSGSPTLNSKGEVIGIVSEAKEIYVTAKKITHLQNLLKTINNTKGSDRNNDIFQKQLTHIHQLADNGNITAQLQLCKMYEQGVGVKRNNRAFLGWCQMAANDPQGHPEAQFILGTLYEECTDTNPNCFKESIKQYKRSALQGYARAEFNLGIMYFEANDFEESRKWFVRAKNNGDPTATYMLNLIDNEFYLNKLYRWISPYLPEWIL